MESKGLREDFQKISRSVVYDHSQIGQVYLLILHKGIHSDHLDHHILCPMQYIMHGVEINETPKFFLNKPTESSHVIIVDDPEGGGLLVIPLLSTELQVTSHIES